MYGSEQKNVESLEHLFRDCNVSARIWAGSDLGIRTENTSTTEISTWIINWIRYLINLEEGERRVIRFMATLWGLWVLRNNIIFKGMSFVPQVFYSSFSKTVTANLQVDASWEKNYDAAIGWIAYSSSGSVINHRSIRMRVESALQAEALGIWDVLKWACNSGQLHLEVLSDCLQPLNQIAGVEKGNHIIKGILEEIQKLYVCFHCLCFNFIPRHLNMLAHGLAR
ncbi:uncharacterized protein LOC141587724 [Silene latifolia]|uniref:uncharacterized protein LOC141587724 n=1 Tax=Silene latifolia TaxID=37657 RepID=UPI003D781F20